MYKRQVFSPRGEDGRPRPLFDWESGQIDSEVARAWEAYDIRLILERRWEELGPKLAGKLTVFCGTADTFRLEGALYLLRDSLEALGSDASIVFAEGRTHGDLYRPLGSGAALRITGGGVELQSALQSVGYGTALEDFGVALEVAAQA